MESKKSLKEPVLNTGPQIIQAILDGYREVFKDESPWMWKGKIYIIQNINIGKLT